MIKILFTLILLLSAIAEFSNGAEILELIEYGRLEQARQMISEKETAVTRDGNLLYYQSLIESEGPDAYGFMQAAYKAGLNPSYMEAILYNMALYHLADGEYDKLLNTTDSYFQSYENGKYRTEVIHLAAVANQKLGNYKKSNYYRDLLMRENKNTVWEARGKIESADHLYSKREYRDAQAISRNLRSSSYDEAASSALYMLSFNSIRQKRIDDAILYYNLLKEGYPNAVGLSELMQKFGSLDDGGSESEAEKLTGTVYSVQVGVFSVEDNAKKMAGRMKQFGQKVEMKEKLVSGKKYYYVLVGRFITQEKAMAFRAKLEQNENIACHVVAQ